MVVGWRVDATCRLTVAAPDGLGWANEVYHAAQVGPRLLGKRREEEGTLCIHGECGTPCSNSMVSLHGYDMKY